MLDRDTMEIGKQVIESEDDREDFHECLKRVKELSERKSEIGEKEEFLGSIDRYLKCIESDS